MMACSKWECDSGREYQNKVEDHGNCLDSSHYPGHGGGKNPMTKNTSKVSAINSSFRGRPIAVTGNDNYGEEHESEAIYYLGELAVTREGAGCCSHNRLSRAHQQGPRRCCIQLRNTTDYGLLAKRRNVSTNKGLLMLA